MAAKTEETPARTITGEASDPVRDPVAHRTASEYFEKGKEEEEEEKEVGSRAAKRRRTCQLALEKFSSASEEEESRRGERLSFSFSFDTRSISPIETTPKFGSFNSLVDLVELGTEGKRGRVEEEKSGAEEEGGGEGEGKIGI